MTSETGFAALLRRRLPILEWGAQYSGQTLVGDLVAAAIVSMMLIPQSLAYALLVGLPPQLGLYASMAPLLLYAVFGTSRALAVGPVAVASLMTGAAAAQVAAAGTPEHIGAAVAIALLTGILMIAMGLLRLGFLANFLSHPVVSGFITAAAVQIAAGQIGPLLGVKTHGESLLEILESLLPQLGGVKPVTAAIGITAMLFLLWAKRGLKPLMVRFGLGDRPADIVAKAAPAMAIVVCTAAVGMMGLDARGVGILGAVPAGLPKLALPSFDAALWTKILVPSLLICIVGYVESISVALTLAAKRRQRVDPDQELIALGVADIGSAVSGGFPVTGALSRSVVNFEAGAQTPAAGAFAAIGVALATLFLTPLLFFMPKTALAAIIIVAVLSLVDVAALKHTWDYSRAEFAAMVATILVTWLDGVESGLIAGVGTVDLPASVCHVAAPRGGHRADTGDFTLPQRRAPRGGDGPGDPVAAGGCQSVLSECPLHRGAGQRIGGRQPCDPPRHSRVHCREYDRPVGARKPVGRQQAARGWRDPPALVRSQGAGDGPAQAIPFPAGTEREGASVALRCARQHPA
jgi:SulP family sulfate permease